MKAACPNNLARVSRSEDSHLNQVSKGVLTIATFKYKAFISYSHGDERWALWLHKALETYRVPKHLVVKHGLPSNRLIPIFRDRDELASSIDLSATITDALKESENLIVICSPTAAESRWVNEEVIQFKRMGKAQQVFCLLVGEPGQSFPSGTLINYDVQGRVCSEEVEPLAADARLDGKQDAKLKIIAGLLGIGLDELKQRELRRQHQRMGVLLGLSLAIALVMSVLLVAAIDARNDAEKRRLQAEDLISFMLGDLHERLEAIGRLEIMDAVGDKSLDYFGSLDTEDVTANGLEKRGRALRQIGDIRVEQGRYEDGFALYQQSLDQAQQANSQESTESRLYELALTHLGLSMVHYIKRDLEQSNAETLHYRTLIAELAARYPENMEYMGELATADNNLGALTMALGKPVAALEHLLRGLNVAQTLSERQPNNPDHLSQVAGLLTWIGDAGESMGDTEQAIDSYTEAVQVHRSAVALDEQPQRRESLSRALTILAVAERDNDWTVAIDHLDEAVAILRRLTRHDPDNADWRQKLNRALTITSATEMMRGCSPRIPVLLNEVLEVATALLVIDEGYVETHRDLIDAGILTARYAIGRGQLSQAVVYAEAATTRGSTMLAREAADPLSKRYYLRAVQVLVRALLLRGDTKTALEVSHNALRLIGDEVIPDQSAAVIVERLRNMSDAELSGENPMEQGRTELRAACDNPLPKKADAEIL